MSGIIKVKPCTCQVCRYGAEIQALADRQSNEMDRKRVEDLYERFALTEDYNGLCRGRWREVGPVLCLIRRDHFLTDKDQVRLDGHEECPMCTLLEKIL